MPLIPKTGNSFASCSLTNFRFISLFIYTLITCLGNMRSKKTMMYVRVETPIEIRLKHSVSNQNSTDKKSCASASAFLYLPFHSRTITFFICFPTNQLLNPHFLQSYHSKYYRVHPFTDLLSRLGVALSAITSIAPLSIS